MVGSMALQFRLLAAFSTATSSAASGGTSTLAKRPPLNHGRSSTPNRPPSRMVASSEPSCVRSRAGVVATPTRRSNRREGSRPTSSAKKQNTHCVRKWLACCAGTPARRSRSAVPAKVRAAASVMSRLVRRGLKASGASHSARRRWRTSC